MNLNYDKIKESVEIYNNILMNMLNDIERIKQKSNNIDLYWKSSSKEFFCKKFNNEINKFEDIYKELKYSILYLQRVSDEYEKLDNQVKNQILAELNNSTIFRME